MSTGTLERPTTVTLEAPAAPRGNHASGWIRADVYVPELERQAKERAALLVGELALSSVLEVDFVPEDQPTSARPAGTTLRDNVCLAKKGDQDASEILDLCIDTEIAERLFVAGHHTRIPLQYGTQGFEQKGVSLERVSLNTVEHVDLNDVMYGRVVHGELKNSALFNLMKSHGVLDDYDAVVWSTATADAETASEFNFSQEAATMTVQMLYGQDTDYTLETALVSGKTSPDSERHDMSALNRLANKNGIDISGEDEDSMVQVVWLIPKGSLQHGLASLIEQYDDEAGGTFYGQAEERVDYGEHVVACYGREFGSIKAHIKQQLFAEIESIETPLDVVLRLDQLSRKYCVEAAVLDDRIDERVFGEKAAPYIRQARAEIAEGNYGAAEASITLAKENETSNSCPISLKAKSYGEEGEDDFSGGSGEDEGGEREMTCPFCKEKVKGDPCASSITCSECRSNSQDDELTNVLKAAAYHREKMLKTAEHQDSTLEQIADEIVKLFRGYGASDGTQGGGQDE